MRWFIAAAVILIATPAFAQENEAEKLFRAMEKKIMEAKSLKVVWEAQKRVSGEKDNLNGMLLLAGGNKAHIEFAGTLDVAPLPMLIVSDGKQTVHRWGKQKDQENRLEPTPPLLNQEFNDMVRRPGFIAGHFIIPFFAGMRMEKIDVEKMALARDFKMGAKESIGGREAQVVEYDISIYGAPKLKARVWIDTKLLTPFRRHYELLKQEHVTTTFSITETYTEFIINPQLDPKLFELPK